ncbi:MAG: hypothetical protein L6R40_005296 [Gallowayella cf. fulva]|nr:MAG: hypothetical protein L6R40_005296 [Xanthomendoza cf. fulva]
MHGSRLAVFATAIALPLVPAQSQGAATSGLTSTKCDLTDFACICSAVEFIMVLTDRVKASCSTADQQTTLNFAQSLCSKYGISLNVPAVAAAANAPSSSAAAPAPAASPAASSAPATSSVASDAPDQDAQDDGLPAPSSAAKTADLAAASSPEAVSTAPVSHSDLPTSSSHPPDDTTAGATPSIPISTSTFILYDTKSTIPSATIASSPMSTSADASASIAQLPASTTAYRNATANATVAASSPIPFVGAAVRDRVQRLGMTMMVGLGVFWGY